MDTRPFFLGQVGPGNEAILRHLHGAGTGLLAQAMRGGVVEVSEATCIVYAPYGESVLPIRKILNICDVYRLYPCPPGYTTCPRCNESTDLSKGYHVSYIPLGRDTTNLYPY